MTVEFATFDASDYLDSEEVIAEYLCAASDDPNPDVLLRAHVAVAKVRSSRAQVSRDSGLERRESFYNDHVVAIVNAILAATVIIQIILVRGWTY